MLHTPTLLYLTALLFLLLPMLVWWVTLGARNRAVAWWCIGSVLAGIGVLLMGLRPWIVWWASYHGGNICVLMACVLWSQSLRLFLQNPWSKPQMLLWALAAVAYYSVLYEGFSPDTRGVGMRVALGSLTLYTAWLATLVSRHVRSHNAAVIAFIYLMLGLVMWLQLLVHGGGGQLPSPFSNTWDASMLAMVTLVSSAVGHFCFAGMMLDDSSQAQIAAAQAHVSERETARRGALIRLVDRQKRLLLITGSLAHELNQPLTAALTQAQVVQRQLKKGGEAHDKLGPLLQKTERSIVRASDILKRIRASQEQSKLRMTQLDLRQVTESALELMMLEWRALGLHAEVDLGEVPLWFKGDEVSITQVLLNVLRNATQALERSAQPRLEVRCLNNRTDIGILVRDWGPGVPLSVLSQWGEPFVGTQALGLGLGLAISRSIMEQHQGRLDLGNHPQGGAQVTIELPMCPPKGVLPGRVST